MRLSIYDKDLNRIGIIGNSFRSCLWSEGYNTVQPFTLELNATDEWKKKIQEDFYIGRMDRPTLMVIKSVQYTDNKIVVSGKQATRILADVAMIGTIAAGGYIDSDVQKAYNQSSKYRNLSVKTKSDFVVRHPNQISNKSFLEVCDIMCQDTETGYKVIKEGSGLVLEFYKPEENPNLIFSEAFGNLSFGSLTRSTEPYKNYAVVLGQGEGSTREKVVVDLSAGSDRRELIVDAKDLQQEQGESLTAYRDRLKSRGVEKLLECKHTKAVVFSPRADDFGKKFDLGDVITVRMPEYGLTIKSRLAKFSQKEQDNKTVTNLEVGNITILR